MDRRAFIGTLTGGLLAAPLAARAQPAGKIRRIGWLSAWIPATPPFLQGLRQLGWMERQNLVIERRSAAGHLARLPDLAAELVRLEVEIIVAGDSAAIGPARQVTKVLPIVMTVSGDPVAGGFRRELRSARR